MLYQHILVPYDRSDSAKAALQEALRIATQDTSTKVTVLTVAEPAEQDDAILGIAERMAGVIQDDREALRTVGKEYLDKVKQQVEEDIAPLISRAPNVVEVAVRRGKPHSQIVKFASEGSYDLIVMGSRGLSALQGMLGSVSYAVLRASKIPVLVVK